MALPVFSGYALPDGRASELLIEHYAALARSGVAMVVVANAAVAADGAVAVNNLRADADEFIPGPGSGWRARSSAQGALAVLQLNHGGRFAKTPQPLAPSALDAAHIPFHLASLKEFMELLPPGAALRAHPGFHAAGGRLDPLHERRTKWRRSPPHSATPPPGPARPASMRSSCTAPPATC
ncbi:MAG: hypothetical protein MZV70_05110 [Desulfobacterales bacterium]|nr:hypothetical protein [Desulfobacterales bacterium]